MKIPPLSRMHTVKGWGTKREVQLDSELYLDLEQDMGKEGQSGFNKTPVPAGPQTVGERRGRLSKDFR